MHHYNQRFPTYYFYHHMRRDRDVSFFYKMEKDSTALVAMERYQSCFQHMLNNNLCLFQTQLLFDYICSYIVHFPLDYQTLCI